MHFAKSVLHHWSLILESASHPKMIELPSCLVQLVGLLGWLALFGCLAGLPGWLVELGWFAEVDCLVGLLGWLVEVGCLVALSGWLADRAGWFVGLIVSLGWLA